MLGLGNPGPEYDGTRHNVGFAVVDRLAARLGLDFRRAGRAECARRQEEGGPRWLLAKPNTYMNLSGRAATQLLADCQTPPQLLVVCDDLHLDLGRLRCRLKGSAGGQNGLASILQALGTQEVPRLRLGIGDPGGMPWEDYVLRRFKPAEREEVERMTERAADVVQDWLGHGDWSRLVAAANAAA